MTPAPAAFDLIAEVSAQDSSVVALRMILFAIALMGAFAWSKGLPRLSLALVILGAFSALGFWLVQIRNPFGLGVNDAISRDWAQAGVNAGAGRGGGYVIGTAAEKSLVAAVAVIGVSPEIVSVVPQIAALCLLASMIFIPRFIARGPSSALFTIALCAAGGLWPGVSPFASALRGPGFAMAAISVALVVSALARFGSLGRTLRRRARLWMLGGAVLLLAAGGDRPQLAGTLLLIAATSLLAPRVRALIRVASSRRRRSFEAVFLAAAFTGGGLFWWNPPQSVPGFHAAREETQALRKPLDWIRENVGSDDVVVASPTYSLSVAALGQRRVLWQSAGQSGEPSPPEPFRRARLYESILRGRPIERLASHFNATHLLLGPGEPTPAPPEQGRDVDEPVRHLLLVYQDAEDFRVFRLVKK